MFAWFWIARLLFLPVSELYWPTAA